VNYLSPADLPISVPKRVLAKSSGYTILKPIAPAVPLIKYKKTSRY